MIYTFGNGEVYNADVIDFQDCREARGFAPFTGDHNYNISTKQIKTLKLTELDKRILAILRKFPLLSCSSIEDLAGRGAAKRVAELYHAGILSRFAETREHGELSYAVYYISENGFSMIGKAAGSTGFPAGSVEDMTVPKRIEASVLSSWLAYTSHSYDSREARLISFAAPDQGHPYLEGVVCKLIQAPWYKIHTKCRFHIICKPKSQDAIAPFFESLVYFGMLARDEEQRMVNGCSRSFIVILCESDENMEKLAVNIESVFGAGGIQDTLDTHFLYSLESDAMDELGAFKFLSRISFPEGMVKRQQLAFK